MKESDDIANLFRHFGGQPGQYQEINRANEARQSRERWPLLASIEADQAAQLPAVDTPAPRNVPPVQQPAVQPVAAPPAAEPAMPPAGRIEPHLSAPPAAEQTPDKPRAAEFIPPRAGARNDKMRPLAALAAQAVEPPAPQASLPAPTARRTDAGAPAAGTRAAPEQEPEPPLQALFTRLARPATRAMAEKGSASLLERLNRL